MFVVVFAHMQQIFVLPYWFPHYPGPERALGWYFYQYIPSYLLMFFFSCSGILIFHSMCRNISRYGNFSVKQFLISRLLRLYLPLILILILMIVLYSVLDLLNMNTSQTYATGNEIYLARNALHIDWKNILGSLFFINTLASGFDSPTINGPLWSLAHEFWFYIAGMVLVILTRARLDLLILSTCASVAFSYNKQEFWSLGFCVWVIAFLMMYLKMLLPTKSFHLISVLGALIFFLIWIYFVSNYNDSWFDNRNYFFIGMSVSFIFPTLINRDTEYSIIPGFISSWLLKVDRFCYSLYLSHFPIFLTVFALTNSYVNNLLIRVVICCIAMFLAYQYAKFSSRITENREFFYQFKRRFVSK